MNTTRRIFLITAAALMATSYSTVSPAGNIYYEVPEISAEDYFGPQPNFQILNHSIATIDICLNPTGYGWSYQHSIPGGRYASENGTQKAQLITAAGCAELGGTYVHSPVASKRTVVKPTLMHISMRAPGGFSIFQWGHTELCPKGYGTSCELPWTYPLKGTKTIPSNKIRFHSYWIPFSPLFFVIASGF